MSNFVVEIKRGKLEGNKYLIKAENPIEAITLVLVGVIKDTTLGCLELSADLLV